MPTVTASCRSALAPLALALALAACSGGGSSDGGADDLAGLMAGSCTIDTSSPAAPIAIGAMPATGQVCPRGDEDWYAIDVPQGADLIDLGAGYPDAATRVSVSAQLFQADGKTPVSNGQLVDGRVGVRKGLLSTTLRVPQPGRYLLLVRDAANTESDAVNSYVIRATTAKDPDTHEPNDTIATAKSPDGQPGWFASRGDVDQFKVTIPQGSTLLAMKLLNPAAAKAVLHYRVLSSVGNLVGEGDAPPSDQLIDAVRVMPSQGDFTVALSAAGDAPPDRRPEAAYTIDLAPLAELDPNDQGVRNDDGATAICLGGNDGNGCGMDYAGTPQRFAGQGQIGSLGDRDVFRFDVASGVPALVEIEARIGKSPVQLAVDVVVPHAGSTCTADSDCVAINQTCKADSDCELSHACLPAAAYHFCPNGAPCRLCAGATACLPLDARGGKQVCGVPQYLVHDDDGMMTEQGGANVIRTAQPLLQTGPVYVVVHDFQDDAFDRSQGYTLDVRTLVEPDPWDQPPTAAARNNFYDPYPAANDSLAPSAARAKDITDDLMAGKATTGLISYSSDEDWFFFKHPCPKLDCGLVFEWTQPGPSPVKVAFLMRRDDLSIHESWTYTGNVQPPALAGPVTSTFGEGDCHECSFASRTYAGKGYYLQVRAVGSKAWDSSAGGAYRFRLKSTTPGCPIQCGELPDVTMCGCFCRALNKCPPGPAL